MSESRGTILVVDDEKTMRNFLELDLQEKGFEVLLASSREEGLQKAIESNFDLALIDMKLPYETEGIRLMEDILSDKPDATVIIMTAYSSRETIISAMQKGAYYYLDKTEKFEDDLMMKIEQAFKTITDNKIKALSERQKQEKIEELWELVQTESNSNKKGRFLETLFELIFNSIEGFRVTTRVRSPHEEIDIVINNESSDPAWKHEGKYILGECKNWSSKVDRDQIDAFRRKLETKFKRVKLGLFIAVSGVEERVRSDLHANSKSELAVVLLTREHIEELVEARDRNVLLKKYVDEGIIKHF